MKHLKIVLLAIFCLCLACSDKPTDNPVIEDDELTKEAKDALVYLNKIRANPRAYSEEIGADLSYCEPRHALIWNDTLAKVAMARAKDMKDRFYFAHVDPDGYGVNYHINKAGYKLKESYLTNLAANNFESIAAGYKSAIEAINGLILDKGVPSLGHRYHLLSQPISWARCYDIGIGITHYPSYYCVIIAAHN